MYVVDDVIVSSTKLLFIFQKKNQIPTDIRKRGKFILDRLKKLLMVNEICRQLGRHNDLNFSLNKKNSHLSTKLFFLNTTKTK